MRLEPVRDAPSQRSFHRVAREVYRAFPHHRATEDEVVHTLAGRKTVFFEHAKMELFLAYDGERPVARFALLRDLRRPEYLQIALFEALPGLDGLLPLVLAKGRELFPDCRRVVAGLNGHLNYSAGFLASRFDEPPLFGLPYTPPYYLEYFPGLERREMFSFRFESAPFVERVRAAERQAAASGAPATPRVRVRPMNRRNLASEVELYTRLNNLCFQQHPYWADRSPAEDLELFSPFRHFLDDENLLFAEVDGEPVGFLLWYPDFNELAAHGEPLGLKHLLKFRLLGRKPQAMRLTEVAVIEAYRNRGVVPALFNALAEQAGKHGYLWCEGGFVFEENRECVSTVLSSIKRAVGKEPGPYRRYCVFEGAL